MKRVDEYWGDINTAITRGIAMASELGEPIEFDFNGIVVQLASDSDPALILREFYRGYLRPSGTFTINPHPPIELSAEQVDEDARLTKERNERQAVASAEYEKRRRNAAALLEGALSAAPALELKDPEGWQKSIDANTDGYGGAVIRFAGDWARLMQMKIAQGDKLADIADECCSVADGPEGITGFMYGCAVGILSHVWIHGEELRRWHNLKTQIKDEGERANESGGVLNPALLSIG